MILISTSCFSLLNYTLIPAMGIKFLKKYSLAIWNWSNCVLISQLCNEPGSSLCILFTFDTILLFLN